MTACRGQSGCLSASSFENMASTSDGECWPSNSGLSGVGGRPISARKRCHGSDQERTVQAPWDDILYQRLLPFNPLFLEPPGEAPLQSCQRLGQRVGPVILEDLTAVVERPGDE